MYMNYAIKELKNYARIMRGSMHTESISMLYKEAAECLENKTVHSYDDEIVDFLEQIESTIKIGLDSWGDNYQEEKKRQQKKLSEVKNAIRICKSNNEVVDGLKGLAEHVKNFNK